MNYSKWEISPEWVIVVIFSLCFLIIGPANILDKRISHEHPYNILASDAAGELAFVSALNERGGYQYMAPHICAGYDDCIGFHPYLFQHLAAVFSNVSGLEVHNVNIFFSSIFLLISSIIMFLFIRKWNASIAYLSMPLMIFALMPQFRIGLFWGYYDAIIASVFAMVAIFMLDDEKEKKWILLSIIISAAFIAHVSEAVYIVAVYAISYIIKWVKERKISKKEVYFIIKTGLLSFTIVLYFGVIFKLLWYSGHTKGPLFGAPPKAEWYDPVISNFSIEGLGMLSGLPLYFIIAGAAISLFAFRKHFQILFAWIMLLFGFNPIGFEAIRTFKIRYLWPLYLSVFFGVALFFIMSLIHARKKELSLAVGAILLIAISYANYEPSGSAGMIDNDHWSALNWLRQNTSEKSIITVMYCDVYNQDAILWNSFRTSFRILENSFIKNLQDGKITKYFSGRVVGPSDVGYAYWKGFLQVGRHKFEEEGKLGGERNICLSEHIMFDKVSRQEVLAQYNMVIAQKLTEKGQFEVAYQNGAVLIIKNKAFNKDCMEEGELNVS